MNASEERITKHFKGMFGLFKLTEFPKNAVQTPNPLIPSCRCCFSDFYFCACTKAGCANVVTKEASIPCLSMEYTCMEYIREGKHGILGTFTAVTLHLLLKEELFGYFLFILPSSVGGKYCILFHHL